MIKVILRVDEKISKEFKPEMVLTWNFSSEDFRSFVKMFENWVSIGFFENFRNFMIGIGGETHLKGFTKKAHKDSDQKYF